MGKVIIPLEDLIAKAEEKTGLIKDDIAAWLREHGIACSTSSFYNWARGRPPAQNSEPTIREALQQLMDLYE